MEKNVREKVSDYNLKNTNGITLVALVVTLIVLLILAGVALSSVLSQDGIFKRAENATGKYGQAKARETLELAFGTLQAEKYEERLSPDALDTRITEEINKMGGEETGDDRNEVVVDGYRFLVDRTVPKIVEELGPADGIVISAKISGNKNGWFKQGETVNVTVTGIIKTYSGGTITNVSATKGGTAISDFSIDNDGKYTISNITADTTIDINAKDSNNKENTKTVPITIRIDNIAPILTEVTATAGGNRIKIKGTATDNESGLKHISYSVEPTTIKDNKATGTLSSGQEITLTATTSEEYTITFTAEDNAGNLSEVQTKTVETLGVIKHIKTPTELKEVNTVDIYGSDVLGYNCTRTGVEWQLFYIDEEDDHRVYLISKDYMNPPTIGTELKRGDTSYTSTYRWNATLLDKYKTTIPASNTTTTLGKFMGKFLSDYAGQDASLQENLQPTNYMLNQDVWMEYMSTNNKSDLAFGGPTLPLLQASYNDICKAKTKLGIQKDGIGYLVNKGGGNWSTSIAEYGDTSTQKGIYFKGADTSSSSAAAMWVASPSPRGAGGNIMYTRYYGSIGAVDNDGSFLGFRPIVSLKSSIQFTENANGSYTIN